MLFPDDYSRTVFQRRSAASYDSHKRRARQSHARLDYSLGDLRHAIGQADTCPYCLTLLLPTTFSCDHDMPVSRTNNFSLTNLVTCCTRCNQTKGNMSGDEFLRLLSLLNDFNPAARQSVLSRLRAGGRLLHR